MSGEDFRSKVAEKERRQRAAARKRQVRRTRLTILLGFLIIAGIGTFAWWKLTQGEEGTNTAKTNNTALEASDASTEEASINPGIGIAERLDVQEGDSGSNKDGKDVGSEGDARAVVPDDATDFDIELTFVGDCCMATQLEDNSEGTMLWYEENYPQEYFFEKVSQYFENDDLTVANCENAFSDNPGSLRDKGPDGGFWFKSPAKNAQIFKVAGIDAVTICNNHILDYGEDVLQDTKKALDDAGVMWGYRDKIIYYEKGGFKIAVICSAYYTPDEVYETEEYLEEAKKNSDFQIIYYHGGIEHIYYPEGWMIEADHSLIDQGADLIIGSHPHCLQQIEQYNGVDIVYSLGNFCFGGNDCPLPNRTMIYKYHLKIHRDNGKNVLESGEREIIPCYVFTGDTNNWQPAPITNPEEAYEVTGFVMQEIDLPWPVYGDLWEDDEEESNEESYEESYDESYETEGSYDDSYSESGNDEEAYED